MSSYVLLKDADRATNSRTVDFAVVRWLLDFDFKACLADRVLGADYTVEHGQLFYEHIARTFDTAYVDWKGGVF